MQHDVDVVADMRFLPNPYWNEDLRGLTGQDETVREYVLSRDGAEEFLDAYAHMIDLAADGYLREGKRFTIFDIDPATAEAWGQALLDWARTQPRA